MLTQHLYILLLKAYCTFCIIFSWFKSHTAHFISLLYLYNKVRGSSSFILSVFFWEINLPSTQDEPKVVDQPAGDPALQSAPLSCSPAPLPSVFPSAAAAAPVPSPASSPQADGKPAAPEENGDAELEPMRNGAGHISETESSDSGATPGDKENSMGASQDIEG